MPSRPGQRSYRLKNQWRTTVRKQVLSTTGGRCRLCGHPGSDGKGAGLQLAHLVEHALGGSDDASNLVPLCDVFHGKFDADTRARRRAGGGS